MWKIESIRIRCFTIFKKFIYIVSTLYHNFTEFIILFCPFSVISFAGYKKYIIRQNSDRLPAFICASAIPNLLSISLGVNISIPFSFVCFYIRNILQIISKVWRISFPFYWKILFLLIFYVFYLGCILQCFYKYHSYHLSIQ